MDVLNAVLATRFDRGQLVVVDQRLSPFAPFDGVELLDEASLRCRTAERAEPYLLHHVLRKPWLAATKSNVYSRLLTRVLLEPDVELRLDPEDLPLRLRRGWLASADRVRASVQASVRPYVRGRIGVRRRLAARRRSHELRARSASAAG